MGDGDHTADDVGESVFEGVDLVLEGTDLGLDVGEGVLKGLHAGVEGIDAGVDLGDLGVDGGVKLGDLGVDLAGNRAVIFIDGGGDGFLVGLGDVLCRLCEVGAESLDGGGVVGGGLLDGLKLLGQIVDQGAVLALGSAWFEIVDEAFEVFLLGFQLRLKVGLLGV